jgi:hypothetical protein
MMTSISATAGTAEILLITDSPVNDGLLKNIRKLFGECTSDRDIRLSPDRRSCRWPLRASSPTGVVDSLSFHVFLCSSFLKQRRDVVDQLYALGCNLELRVNVPDLTENLSITASTMKQLSDLHIQFSLIPATASDLTPLAGE